MATGTIWTEEMKATAAGMKRAGLTTKAIAARLGITEKAVSHKLHQMRARKRLDGKPSPMSPRWGRIQRGTVAAFIDTEDD
jgi:hypothetical protein